MVTREGSGTGQGKGLTPGEAHEIALKSAETDATKRALSTFGNRIGLALYDPQQAGVRQRPPKESSKQVSEGPWTLNSAAGEEIVRIVEPEAYMGALKQAMAEAKSIDLLFDVWEANLPTVRALNAWSRHKNGEKDVGQTLVKHLRNCAMALVDATAESGAPALTDGKASGSGTKFRQRVDKSQLTFGEIKRVRSREHLRFVAKQPCLICARAPSQAHHVRFAQPRGLGLKVSDEFTVPLCAIHHMENHATGDERQWWQKQKLDPLSEAEKLWRQSQGASATDNNGRQ